MERFYFFLEYDDYQQKIKKFIPPLKRIFLKFKHSDLRISECISSEGFVKMCKELTIIPVFMSAKEALDVNIIFLFFLNSLFKNNN